eukprot:Blabericola_migrator_1__7265@NODE_3691_length_1572_cov_3_519601_g2289_i0_p2_GENE_NODE_3691_length_1572_cov_3_519601_g2289_i0NODE_3691_length_1572_cov_3_519601_g2289_i0_p2_ORF_typecomplete_len118_score4_54RMI1_C/PF16099_5/0_17_NODE_3691_length_1572_cov_3_519601_g2289_i075428
MPPKSSALDECLEGIVDCKMDSRIVCKRIGPDAQGFASCVDRQRSRLHRKRASDELGRPSPRLTEPGRIQKSPPRPMAGGKLNGCAYTRKIALVTPITLKPLLLEQLGVATPGPIGL